MWRNHPRQSYGDTTKGKLNSSIKRIGRPGPKLSQSGFYLRPKFFNRVQVRAAHRWIKGLRSGITGHLAHRLDVVSPEIVHYHNIAWQEGGNQILSLLSYHISSLRSCLASIQKQTNKSERKHLKRVLQYALTVFPKSAVFIDPSKRALDNPAFWQP